MRSHSTSQRHNDFFSKPIPVEFSDDFLTSDPGLLLIRQLAERIGLAAFFRQYLSPAALNLLVRLRREVADPPHGDRPASTMSEGCDDIPAFALPCSFRDFLYVSG